MTSRGDSVVLVNEDEIDPVLGTSILLDMSWSRLDCYDWCPKKYKFKYCDGLADGWTLPLAIGKTVHETLEAAIKYRVKDEVEIVGFFLDAVDRNDRDGKMSSAEVEDAKDLALSTFREISATTEIPNIVDVEFGFAYKLGRGLFLGFIDLVFWGVDEEGPYLQIRDYKTGKKKKKTKDSGQMKLYTLAVKRLYPDHRVKAGLYWVRDDTEDVYEFSDAELDDFKQKVAGKIEQIIEDDNYHPTKEMFKCVYCVFAREDVCKYGYVASQKITRYRKKKKTT